VTFARLNRKALDPVDEARDVLIDEQADLRTRHLHVGQQLRVMQRRQRFHALEFDDHTLLHDDVGLTRRGLPFTKGGRAHVDPRSDVREPEPQAVLNFLSGNAALRVRSGRDAEACRSRRSRISVR